MKTSVIIVMIILSFNNLFSQKLLKGKILLEDNIGYNGIYVCDYSNLLSYTMVDKDGTFSISLSDTSKYIVTSSVPPTSSLFDNQDYWYKKFDIAGKEILNLITTTERNTFDTIPASRKIKKLSIHGEKYKLRFNLHDKLRTIIYKTNTSKYKLKFNYSEDRVQISWYIMRNLFRRPFYLSSITYTYDKQGAIRTKSVNVEYGSHCSWELSRFFYHNNKIYRIEVYSNENMGKTIHTTNTEMDLDVLSKLVQNEILRKKIYDTCKEVSFDFDNTFKEIKE